MSHICPRQSLAVGSHKSSASRPFFDLVSPRYSDIGFFVCVMLANVRQSVSFVFEVQAGQAGQTRWEAWVSFKVGTDMGWISRKEFKGQRRGA